MRAGKALKTFIDMCPKVRNGGHIEVICSGPPVHPPLADQQQDEEGEEGGRVGVAGLLLWLSPEIGGSGQPELWIHGRIQPPSRSGGLQAGEPVEVKLEKGWEVDTEAERLAAILTKEGKRVNLRIILSRSSSSLKTAINMVLVGVIATTTNVRLALIAELLARTGRLCEEGRGGGGCGAH